MDANHNENPISEGKGGVALLKEFSVVEIENYFAKVLSDLAGEQVTVSIDHIEFSSNPMDAHTGKRGRRASVSRSSRCRVRWISASAASLR